MADFTCPSCGQHRQATDWTGHHCQMNGGKFTVFGPFDPRAGLMAAHRNEDPSDEGLGTPSCHCSACSDDEERGCALTYDSPDGRVQCGLPGGHDGSCDFFEAVHGGN